MCEPHANACLCFQRSSYYMYEPRAKVSLFMVVSTLELLRVRNPCQSVIRRSFADLTFAAGTACVAKPREQSAPPVNAAPLQSASRNTSHGTTVPFNL